MDCCTNFLNYRHHPASTTGSGLLGNGVDTTTATGIVPGMGGGGAINGSFPLSGNSYYGHPHTPLRYQHQVPPHPPPPTYRFGVPGGSSMGYNTIGPPNSGPPSNLYSQYERYSSYPNLPPYGCSTNAFSCNNVGMRDLNGFYNHYDRMGNGYSYPHPPPHHHHFREQYDKPLYRSRDQTDGGGYHSYAYLLPGRGEYNRPVSSSTGVHHLQHNHRGFHSHEQQQSVNPTREAFPTHPNHHFNNVGLPPRSIDNQGCAPAASSLDFHSGTTSAPSPMPSCSVGGGDRSSSGNSSNHSAGLTAIGTNLNGNGRNLPENYPPPTGTPFPHGHPRTDCISADIIGDQHQSQQNHQQQHHHHHQKNSPHEAQQQRSTGLTFGGPKELKSRRTSKDREKNSGRLSVKSDSSTSLTNLERTATPFSPHTNSPVNFPPRLQNGFLSSNQASWSPYPDSPQSWSQQYSPKPTSKRLHSPMTQCFVNKNRVLECDFIPSKKSKRKTKSESPDNLTEFREEIKNITPLPGFQQAFGSTEIGRFSESFLNTPESPLDVPYESEADTLSPQPWETGDSLEGPPPHFNLHIGASVQPVFSENHSSIDSPIDNSYFSEIRCSDY